MANSDGGDAARLTAAVTRLERRVEELTAAAARQEAKLDQLLALATPNMPEDEQSLRELIAQLVNITIESNTLLKRMEEHLGRRV